MKMTHSEAEIALNTTPAPDQRGREAVLLDQLADLLDDPDDQLAVKRAAAALGRFYASSAVRAVGDSALRSGNAAVVAWAISCGLTTVSTAEASERSGIPLRTIQHALKRQTQDFAPR